MEDEKRWIGALDRSIERGGFRLRDARENLLPKSGEFPTGRVQYTTR
jgi:hypothetical protein